MLVVVTVGAVGLLSYTAASVNEVQATEERVLIIRRLDRTLAQVKTDNNTGTVWDDAYRRLRPTVDADWADVNIGDYYASFMGHALTVVLDSDDQPVYAWAGEGRLALDKTKTFLKDAAPLIQKVRQEEAVRDHLDRPDPAAWVNAPATASGVVLSGGKRYQVAVATLVPASTDVTMTPGHATLVITSKAMDAKFLRGLEEDLALSDVRFVPHDADTRAKTPITDVNGFVIGDLAWTPKEPGLIVLHQAIPLLVLAMLVLVTAGAALALRIRAVFGDLALNDATLTRTLDELVRARDKADAASVAKSQFLANMSHEIRTPLNGILGMAQVMAMADLSAAQRERLEVVQESGRTLLTVLNDILDISKIEAGRLEIDNHEFDLGEAVRSACGPFASLADQKDVGFRIVVAPEAEGRWWGDGTRLRQVVSNLASNAVKFTSTGEVSVTVTREGEGLRFVVQDSGIGIPQERLGDLFQKFNQVDASTTRRFGGTGLGLAICRELAELMGGRLTVDSAEGEGSRFTADLPFDWVGPALAHSPVQQDADAPQIDPDQPIRILAAEDNPTNQLILRSLLEPLGVDLTLAGHGAAAVEAFGVARFDLILMDVQMPVMNGVEATAEIRRLEAARGLAATPILALSANVMSHQVNEYLDAGMNGFVPKPIDAQTLFAAIEAALAPEVPVQSVAA